MPPQVGGWLPNNPEAQVGLLCWEKLPAAESRKLFAWLLLLLLFCIFFLFFFCHLTHQDQQTRMQQSLASHSMPWYPGPKFYVSGLFSLGTLPDAGLWGSRGMHVFKVLETGMPNCPPGKQTHFILSEAWGVGLSALRPLMLGAPFFLPLFCHLNTKASFLSSAGVDSNGGCWHAPCHRC